MLYSNNSIGAICACERERTGCWGDESGIAAEDFPTNEFYARYLKGEIYNGRKGRKLGEASQGNNRQLRV